MGALAGLLVSIALVWGLLRSTRKVALAPFFRWTGLLIIIIAAGLLSSAVNMLQAADIITFWTTPVFDISHILDDQGYLVPSCAPCLATMPHPLACSC